MNLSNLMYNLHFSCPFPGPPATQECSSSRFFTLAIPCMWTILFLRHVHGSPPHPFSYFLKVHLPKAFFDYLIENCNSTLPQMSFSA